MDQFSKLPRNPAEDRAHPQGVSVFPASYAQRRLWFIDQFDPGNPVYNLSLVYRIEGRIDTRVLERSLKRNVAFVPGRFFFPGQDEGRETARLNFSMADPATLNAAVATLAGAVRGEMAL